MSRFQHHLTRRLDARRTGESGLALLDVLLGMAIFALIAVIAMQGTRLTRERAYTTQTTAAVKDVSLLLEARVAHDTTLPSQGTAGTPSRTFPDWDGAASVASYNNVSGIEGARLTAGVEVARYTLYADQKSFMMCMVHRSSSTGPVDAYAAYHSPSGKIVDSGRGTAPTTGGSPCVGAL